MPRQYATILTHPPCDRLVRALSARDACAHVRKHEGGDDFLDWRRERPRVTRKADELREVLKDLKLGVGADDRHRLPVRVPEEGHVVAATSDHGVLPVVGEVL